MGHDLGELSNQYLPKLTENLEEIVIDFWYPRSIDEAYGGYITNFNKNGEYSENNNKMIVSQSRMVWFFSQLYRDGYDAKFLEAAQQGFEFLTQDMRDDTYGGYYWEVDRDGAVTKPNKHMYGQAFVLYALSEFYKATGEEHVLELALNLFEVFEEKAYDTKNGGYIEYFNPDWTPITKGRTYLDAIEPDWSPKQHVDAEIEPTTKLMNTHLHLMEALTNFYTIVDHGLVRNRLQELLTINTNTVVRKELGACTDKHSPEWKPQLNNEIYRIVSYGHDIENVWLAMDAAYALDQPIMYYLDLFETLWKYTLEYGYDKYNGGFYFFGPFGNPACSRIKAWWVQAEGLVSSLRMFELTGDEIYAEVFTETFAFIERYQTDQTVGEWHSAVTDELEPVGHKGAIYKCAYHNGRALIECINILNRLNN